MRQASRVRQPGTTTVSGNLADAPQLVTLGDPGDELTVVHPRALRRRRQLGIGNGAKSNVIALRDRTLRSRATGAPRKHEHAELCADPRPLIDATSAGVT
jgi:hypothetical protein